jgi:hypothetical protein
MLKKGIVWLDVKKGKNQEILVLKLTWDDEIFRHLTDAGQTNVGVWELDTWSRPYCGLVARTYSGVLGFSWINTNPGHLFLGNFDLQWNCYNVSNSNNATSNQIAFSLMVPDESYLLPPYPWGTEGKLAIWRAGNLKMNSTIHDWKWMG